jgi:o-succinylbenzoate synthase
VKIRRVRLSPYRLPLVAPLVTAHGRLDARRGWLLELESESGAVGRGDACPFPGLPLPGGKAGAGGFGMESWARCGERLREWLPRLVGESAASRSAALEAWDASVPDAPGARFAVDCALTELVALSAARSVAELLAEEQGRRPRARVSVSALVTAFETEAIRDQARSLQAAGFSTFKLKLGAAPLAEDLLRVQALREALGPAPQIRLDANGAWSREQARSALEALGPLDIELVELPVAAEDLFGLGELCGVGGVRVAADEALAGPGGGARVIARQAADCLVLKPAALGGLGLALALAEDAARAGIECVVTHLMDSAFGVAAAAQLAAALPAAGPDHGLVNAGLFGFDLAPPPRIEGGRLELTDAPGWGLDPGAEAMARASLGDATEFAA